MSQDPIVNERSESKPAAPEDQGPGLVATVRGRWRWIVATLLAAALGYGGGRLQGIVETRAVEERAQSEAAEHDRQRQTLAGQLAAAQNDVTLLSARRELERAIGALGKHNYGLAQERAKAASAQLARDETFAPLAAQLKSVNLLQPGESEQLTATLRDVIRSFDERWDQRAKP